MVTNGNILLLFYRGGTVIESGAIVNAGNRFFATGINVARFFMVRFTMTLEALVSAYGYPALAIGTIVEGGTVGMVAGSLAHGGYLQLQWVIVIIFCCAFGSDQFFFRLGKRSGKQLLARHPKWEPRVDRVRRFLVAYQVIAVLSFRFIYGMRTITPLVIGASNFNTRRFILLNFCSTLAWATVVGSSGYFFGHLFEELFADVRHHMLAIVLFGAGIAAVGWLWYRWTKGRL